MGYAHAAMSNVHTEPEGAREGAALLARLELHHLRALDALLQARSVTRAAERLGVTQSAVSHSLRQLREVLGDPLLTRAGGGLALTPRALAVREPLQEALSALGQALCAGAGWDPATARREFRLVMGDLHAATLLPPLLGAVRRGAPGVALDVRAPPEGRPELGLLQGAELAVVVRSPEVAGVRGRTLYEEEFACVVRADHPGVGACLDLETFLSLDHALMSPQGGGPAVVDTALERIGRSRRIALRIGYFMAAPPLIAGSDLILTAPRRLIAAYAAQAPLRVMEPPLPLPPFAVRMLWPDRLHADPGHRWLRDRTVEAALTGAAPARR